MSDTGRPGPERPSGPPTPPPISNWQAQRPTPPPPGPATPSPSVPPATPPTAPAFGPVTPETYAARTLEQEPAPAAASGRPRWLVPAIIGVIVLVAAAIVVAIVVNSNGESTDTPPPAAASTVLLPSPTPTVEPVARTATTAFATALPTTVLQYALATSTPDAEWQAAGAVEAYTETYTDGGSGTVTVRSGQWETPEEAAAFAASLVAAFPAAPSASASPDGPALPQSGDVTAAGAVAGTYSIADAGDGTGIAVWTNGSTVFQATVPVADVVDFYNAFPL